MTGFPATKNGSGAGAPRRCFRVFLVGSEFYRSPGGIQYVNRLLVRALAEFARKTPCEIEVFSYHDFPDAPEASAFAPNMRWHAFGRSRMAMAWGLERRLRAVRPHLVLFTHVHLLRLAALVRVAAADARIAALGHGTEVWVPLPSPIAQEVRRAHALVTPSACSRERLVEVNGATPERVTVIAHGLAPEQAAATAAPPARTGHTLLSVTRLVRADMYKDVDLVLRALPQVLERCPLARYVIVGDGDDRPRLQTIAAELGVAERVEFRGELTNTSLHRAFQEADVFVLPSRTEGFGIVFLEAMAAGLPVIAARSGGAPEVVVDGETGILVPPGDAVQLACAMSGLLLLPEERAAMGEKGRRRVDANFRFAHFAERWHRWLVDIAPEAVYLARHAATFNRVPAAPAQVT